MDRLTVTAEHEGIATETLQLAPGVFVAWGEEDPRIGHVDRPFDLFEISADMVALLARFTQPCTAGVAIEGFALDPDARASVLAALAVLRDAGVLVDPDAAAAPEPLRDAGFEAARATNAWPDIALVDPEFTQLYRSLATVTLTSPQLAYALRSALRYLSRSGVAGDIVECGVWRGGSMALAATTLLEAGDRSRHLWLYDTFDWQWEPEDPRDGFLAAGVPAAGPPPESALAEGTSSAEVVALLSRTGYPAGQLHLVQGLVQDTIPAEAAERIALLRLDTDFYDSTRHELEHLYPRLVSGGVLIVDDYGKLSGATKAVDEYFEALEHPPLLQRIDVQGRMAVKP